MTQDLLSSIKNLRLGILAIVPKKPDRISRIVSRLRCFPAYFFLDMPLRYLQNQCRKYILNIFPIVI